MALSGRAARRVGIAAEAAWDAGLVAVICCFAVSRLLLVLGDPAAFARYPAVVLGLPSLTFGGMALSALAVWAYLRGKRMPVLRVLDAFAPGGALLAGFLEFGHWIDGSEPGMPVEFTRHTEAWGSGIRLYPVSLLGLLLACGLSALLWWLLKAEWTPGRVAALGLMYGGLIALGLDLLSLPSELVGGSWLEPGEWVALCVATVGACLWTFAQRDLALRQTGAFGEKGEKGEKIDPVIADTLADRDIVEQPAAGTATATEPEIGEESR